MPSQPLQAAGAIFKCPCQKATGDYRSPQAEQGKLSTDPRTRVENEPKTSTDQSTKQTHAHSPRAGSLSYLKGSSERRDPSTA